MASRRGQSVGKARGRRAPSLAGVRLRTAGSADLTTLVQHRRRMWQELRAFRPTDLDLHDRVYRRWVRQQTQRGKFVGLIVEDRAGRPLASGGLWLMPSQPRPGPLGRGEVPYILSMFTEPAWRGRGLASRLVRAMVRWARLHRYGRVVLHASRFGRPVYTRLGFVDGSEMRLELVRQPGFPEPSTHLTPAPARPRASLARASRRRRARA